MLLLVHLSGKIRWRTNQTDLPTFTLESDERFQLLNPLLIRELEQSQRPHNPVTSDFGIYRDGEVMFETDSIGLKVNDQIDFGDQLFETLQSFLAQLMTACRLTSKQSELPKFVFAISRTPSDELPELRYPEPNPNSQTAFLAYLWSTALTPDHIIRADKLLQGGGIPAYHDILLDAVQAFRMSDYRRAILYTAIAIESLAAETLNNTYICLLSKRGTSDQWRMIELKQAGGESTRKDPIYEYLIARDDFGALLHERPLYLFQRSLLVEDQDLYRTARELYRTRNKIPIRPM